MPHPLPLCSPTLDKIFNENILKDRKKRDKKKAEAV